MDGFEVLALDHVTVTTPAELESEVARWYEQVLGLAQVDKPQGSGTERSATGETERSATGETERSATGATERSAAGAPERSATGERGVWFKIGDCQIHVSIDPHNPPQKAHFAIRVPDFEACVHHLRSHGCHIEQAKEITGRHRFFTRDPAGNRVELFALDEEAT